MNHSSTFQKMFEIYIYIDIYVHYTISWHFEPNTICCQRIDESRFARSRCICSRSKALRPSESLALTGTSTCGKGKAFYVLCVIQYVYIENILLHILLHMYKYIVSLL